MTASLWNDRADTAQASLSTFFGTDRPQLFDNWYPSFPGSNQTFNYWWLAHVIDAKLDAWERTGDSQWLADAIMVRGNLIERNEGSLYNDYFDDMLWFALALERLSRATQDAQYLDEALLLWEHCLHHGWNDTHGASLAWRREQLYYKNTPANGPFAIVGARLAASTDGAHYLEYATRALAWIETTLRDPVSGFVEDGINRQEDGAIDTQWRFTYNQGLYIGACVALHEVTDDPSLIDRARETTTTALAQLTTPDGVFAAEGDGGDEGLFAGIFYRYGAQLDTIRPHEAFRDFVVTSTDQLWAHGIVEGFLLPGRCWDTRAEPPVPYSALLSAIMATELRAAIAAGR